MTETSTLLTKEELEIFSDPVFFQRKIHITNVIISLLGKLNEHLENNHEVQKFANEFNLPQVRGKISKGENYLGAPWQILDYPRVFKKEDVFAFRTLCWWGHYYTCTLHLAGSYYLNYLKSISKNLHLIKDESVSICVSNKQWDHHHEENNFLLLNNVLNDQALLNKVLTENNFLKLSCKFPLTQVEQLEKNALESFKHFSKVINRNASGQ